MIRIVGISFSEKGRIYNFDALNFELNINTKVIVETERGLQFGFVTKEIKEVEENKVKYNLKPIISIATKEDIKYYQNNIKDASEALVKAKEIVEQLGLDMKLIDSSYTFDRKQLIFNFFADERIDFRELAKKLAQIYHTRIELRQIGIRDKAKEIGGIGPCGRPVCCTTFLTDLNSVTINMAKNQLLSLNPSKINGACGRLLCCLAYEDELYSYYRKKLPNIGDEYKINDKIGKVINIDVIRGKIVIQTEDGNTYETVNKDENN